MWKEEKRRKKNIGAPITLTADDRGEIFDDYQNRGGFSAVRSRLFLNTHPQSRLIARFRGGERKKNYAAQTEV
jgi:hypothetical protein